MTRRPLLYLDFDHSEDAEGTATWDAIASVSAAHLPALQAEIVRVLAWATEEFPGQRGPVEEGGMWDYDLHSEPQDGALQSLWFDAAETRLLPHLAPDSARRHTLTLSISGRPSFAAAFDSTFLLD